MTALQVVSSVAFSVLLLALALTGVVRRYALSAGLMDEPNSRSAHTRSMPRGGGVSIVVASMCGACALWWFDLLDLRLLIALVLGGVLIAGIGLMDDRKGISPIARFIVHIVACSIAVMALGGVPSIALGAMHFELGPAGSVLAVVCLVWVINLFNFMDGIDGIAGAEAVFVTLASATLMMSLSGVGGSASVGLVVGAASLGFLVWNWPPARIFMGDVGSGYVGYSIGLIALAAAGEGHLQVIPTLILGGVFFIDATLTLARRLARGEHVHQAHRTHAYQWLARRWGSHLRVTVLVLCVNVLWLLPFSLWAAVRSDQAIWALVAALVPIGIACHFIGSGVPESSLATSDDSKQQTN